MDEYCNPQVRSARAISSCLKKMVKVGAGQTVLVPTDDRSQVQELFDELETFIRSEVCYHCTTYECAVGAIFSCSDVGGLYPHISTITEVDRELLILADCYGRVVQGQTIFTDKEFDELLRLIVFLETFASVVEKAEDERHVRIRAERTYLRLVVH